MGSRFCTPKARRTNFSVHPSQPDIEPTTQALTSPEHPLPPVSQECKERQRTSTSKYAGFSFSLPKPSSEKFIRTADTDILTLRPSTQRNFTGKAVNGLKCSNLHESQDSLETINSRNLLKSEGAARRNQELKPTKQVPLFIQESMGQVLEYPSTRNNSKGQESPNNYGEEISFTSHRLSIETFKRNQSKRIARKAFLIKPQFYSSLCSDKLPELPPQNPKKPVRKLETGTTSQTQSSEFIEIYNRQESMTSSLISLSESPASRFSSNLLPVRKTSLGMSSVVFQTLQREEEKERLTQIRELASVDTNSLEGTLPDPEEKFQKADEPQPQKPVKFKSKSEKNLYKMQLISKDKNPSSVSPESLEEHRVIHVKLKARRQSQELAHLEKSEIKIPLQAEQDQYLRIPMPQSGSARPSSGAPISKLEESNDNSVKLFSCELSPLNINSEVFDDFTKRVALANMHANLFNSNSTISHINEREASQKATALPPRSPYSKGGNGSAAISAMNQHRYTKSRFSAFHESRQTERSKMTPSATIQSMGQYSFHSVRSDDFELRTVGQKKRKLKKIINQYVVLATIKREGNEKVKQVFSRKDSKIYAMRVLQSAHKNHNTVRYIANLMSLKHPNLLNFVEAIKSTTGQKLYIVTELPTGKTVEHLLNQQKLEQNKGLPLTQCHSFYIQLIQGIQYCHNNAAIPISNLDIKTCNLHLDKEQETLKLAFFAQRKPSSNSGACNPYTAPQIIEGFPPDKASDIWSTGIILFRIATGSYPFFGESAQHLQRAITEREPEYPENMKPMLKDLLTRLLEKDKEKRITMEELIEHDWLTSNGLRPLKAQFRQKGSRAGTELSYPFSRLKIKGLVEMSIKRTVSLEKERKYLE